MIYRRTYGNEGEDIREGFEPNDSSAVVDPKEGDEDDRFTVGTDDHDGESPGEVEASPWKEQHEPEFLLKPKYGLEGEQLENVWGEEPSEPPRENP
jgi:hypothetical protein